jgi:RNA polymerase sigma-70 factor (ECF subfamily)
MMEIAGGGVGIARLGALAVGGEPPRTSFRQASRVLRVNGFFGACGVIMSDNQERELRHREFVRLLAEHDRRLSAYVHALVPRWQDAEDVLQTTKLRLWEQFDSYRPEGDFAAWAIAIAGYMVRTHRTLSQRQRVRFSDDVLERISLQAKAVSPAVQDDRLTAIAECSKTLSDAGRRLLHLFCSGHQRIKDMAQELGQTPTATRVALFRIRKSLYDCVQRRLQQEEERP